MCHIEYMLLYCMILNYNYISLDRYHTYIYICILYTYTFYYI